MGREVHSKTREAYEDPMVVKKYLEAYGGNFHDKVAADFVRSLQGKRVLDLGCGPGHYVKYFSELGCDATGLDYSREMIRVAGELDQNSRYLVGDMHDVGELFPPDSFDGVWANASLLHIPLKDVGAVLTGVAKILSTGGKLLIRTKKGNTGMAEVEENLYGRLITREYTYWQEADLIKELEAHSFVVTKSVDEHEDVLVEKSKRSIDWLQIHAEASK